MERPQKPFAAAGESAHDDTAGASGRHCTARTPDPPDKRGQNSRKGVRSINRLDRKGARVRVGVAFCPLGGSCRLVPHLPATLAQDATGLPIAPNTLIANDPSAVAIAGVAFRKSSARPTAPLCKAPRGGLRLELWRRGRLDRHGS